MDTRSAWARRAGNEPEGGPRFRNRLQVLTEERPPGAPLLEVIIPPEMHRLFLLFGCEGAGGLETLADYLAQAKAPQRRVRMAEVLWSGRNGRFPAWSPGLHGTSPCSQIMGRSSSGSASPPGIWPFLRGGLGGIFPGNRPGRLCRGKMLFRIPWERDVDYTLLRRMIAFNRTEKAHCKTFWRGKA